MKLAAPTEGMAAYGSYRFCAPDPPWVPSAAIERVRRELRAFDERVGIWWSPMRRADSDPHRPGRWRVVEWLPRMGNWSTAFYWEGPDGEYRDFEPVGPIIAKLQRIAKPLDQQLGLCEASNETREERRKKEIREMVAEHHDDFFARTTGVRQTFGPGYIRRREVKRSDIARTNHLKAVEEHAKKWDGSTS